jgi:hypothetical protein
MSVREQHIAALKLPEYDMKLFITIFNLLFFLMQKTTRLRRKGK